MLTGKKNNLMFVLVAFMITMLLVSGCSSSVSNSATPQKEVKIGVIEPLTGETAWGGVPSKWAAQMAADEINAAGGVNGYRLNLIFKDGQTQPQVTASATEELITKDNVNLIMAEWSSSASIAGIGVANKYKIPFLVHLSTADGIAKNGGKYVFQLMMQNADTVKIQAGMMIRNMKFNSIAILAENNDFGKTFLDAMTKAMTEAGKKIAASQMLDRSSTDYMANVTKLKNLNPDVIVFAMTTAAGASFVRTLKEQGVSAQLAAAYSIPPYLYEQAAGNATIGLVRLAFYLQGENLTDKQKQFDKKFDDYYSKKTGQHTPNTHNYIAAYDGIYVMADAVKRGGIDKDSFVKAMEETKYDGVLAHYEFDQNHEVKPEGFRMIFIRDIPGKGDVPDLEIVKDWK